MAGIQCEQSGKVVWNSLERWCEQSGKEMWTVWKGSMNSLERHCEQSRKVV